MIADARKKTSHHPSKALHLEGDRESAQFLGAQKSAQESADFSANPQDKRHAEAVGGDAEELAPRLQASPAPAYTHVTCHVQQTNQCELEDTTTPCPT